MTTQVKLKDVKKGDYIRFTANENGPVWVRGGYIRALGEYELERWDAIGSFTYRKGDTLVYVDFIF